MPTAVFTSPPMESPPPKERTEAQRAASRLNGCKSRGPITRAGKARAAANALADGLLVRKFMPPADHRELDLLYRQIHRELHVEFKPNTFTQLIMVDTLASDYLRLLRAHQMIEAAAAMGGQLSEDEETRWRQLRDAQQDIEIMTRLLGITEVPEGPLCTRDEARRLAKRICSLLTSIEANIAQAAAEAAQAAEAARKGVPPVKPDPNMPPLDSYEPADDFDAQNDARDQRLLETLGDARPQYLDQDHVLALLCGDRVLRLEDWTRVRALLEVMTLYAQWHVDANDSLLRRVERLRRQNLQTLAVETGALLQAERYAHDLERTIAQKLNQLRR